LRECHCLTHHHWKGDFIMKWIIAVSLPLFLSLPAAAHAASAVAYDTDGAYGYSINQASVSAAMLNALQYCGARSRDCGGFASTTNEGYSALATGTGAFGHALGESTPEAARRKAEAMCRKQADDCTLAVMWREDAPRGVPAPSLRGDGGNISSH